MPLILIVAQQLMMLAARLSSTQPAYVISRNMIRFLRGLRKSRPVPGEPRLPAGHRIYAIGDIHGHLDALLRLECMIAEDITARPVAHVTTVFLGDYIDRGPDSRGVIDHLLSTSTAATDRHYLKGNHEATLLSFLETPAVMDEWRRFGGLETLYSYGVDVRRLMRGDQADVARSALRSALPDSHLEFLNALQPMVCIGGYCFVHAGVKPTIDLNCQREESLLWIRDEFLDYKGQFGKVIVHGHTPVEMPQRLANRIAVDTGVYLTGRLSAAVLEGDDVAFLTTDPANAAQV